MCIRDREPDERILALLSKCPAWAEDYGVKLEKMCIRDRYRTTELLFPFDVGESLDALLEIKRRFSAYLLQEENKDPKFRAIAWQSLLWACLLYTSRCV